MTKPPTPDSIVAAWLDEGPNRLPEETRRAIAVDVRITHQRRRGLLAPWRTPTMNGILPRLVVVTAALAVAVGGVFVLADLVSPPAQSGGQPSPSLPQGTASPSALGIPLMSDTFVSPTHGYSIGYPAGSTVEPASEANEGRDFIRGPDPTGVFRAVSTVAPDGVSIDDWIDESLTPAAGDCPGFTLSDIPIDGQVGRVRHGCPGEVEAMVAVGGRAYVFTLFHDGPEARAVFDAFTATIDLRPDDALEAAGPTPS